jgi:hypothetical protein
MAFELGPFRPLLELAVEHAYCADAAHCAFSFQPSAACAHWLAQTGALVRTGRAGLTLFADAGAPPLPPEAAFDFEVASADPLFDNYTAGLDAPAGQVPHYSSADASFDAAGAVWRLQAAQHAPRQAARTRLRLTLRPPAAAAAAGGAVVRLVLPLAARATYWKYLLLGAWDGEAPEIVDAAREVGFEPAVAEPLADGRNALAIRSSVRIALEERPERRFQLRSRRAARGAARVLIKRLPAASPRRFGLAHIAGVPALVSEIYVPR